MSFGAARDRSLLARCVRAAACLLLASQAAWAQEDVFDRVGDALVFGGWNDSVRVQMRGSLDLEAYYLSQQDTGLIFSDSNAVLNPRLSLFLDAQAGSHLYAFVEARADNGFDPGEGGPRVRLDEYALRFSPFDARLAVQVGKFATVVGNWTQRHGSWDNPFITAPLPYENLTGIWDVVPARSPSEILAWAGVIPRPDTGSEFLDEYRNIPVIWGPSYASGAAILGKVGGIDYAVEVKNTSLSSRPETWSPTDTQWQEPTVGARVGYTPNETWAFGVSASVGPYLQQEARPEIPAGRSLDQYLESVVGEDLSYAWHHVQVWAEAYEARFSIPGVGNADTLAYYVEGRYKFTPQFFGALRWNQQVFASLPGTGGIPWSRNVWRIDLGPCYRLTAHAQIKLQWSIERQDADSQVWSDLSAVQLTVRF